MRVALAEKLGGPEVLVPAELPAPVAGPGEVVIDVEYADTIFVDVQLSDAQYVRLAGAALAGAAAGRLRPVIGQVFPLESAALAHAAIEARTVTGKVLLTTRQA